MHHYCTVYAVSLFFRLCEEKYSNNLYTTKGDNKLVIVALCKVCVELFKELL